MQRYDVLLVNPLKDGLNLVAKEGPLLNRRDGLLCLSREAGAYDELQSAVRSRCTRTTSSRRAGALDAALATPLDERARSRHAAARRSRRRTSPADWLADLVAHAR